MPDDAASEHYDPEHDMLRAFLEMVMNTARNCVKLVNARVGSRGHFDAKQLHAVLRARNSMKVAVNDLEAAIHQLTPRNALIEESARAD